MKSPDIRLKPQYQIHKILRNGEILVWDLKNAEMVVMTESMWNCRKGFLMAVINGEIIP